MFRTFVTLRPRVPETTDEVENQAGHGQGWLQRLVCTYPRKESTEVAQGWEATKYLDMSRNANRSQLKPWSGPQAWKLDPSTSVGLIEVYAGRARLSDEFEQACQGSEAIRLGYMFGQDLRSKQGQWFTMSLIDLCTPRDVFV